MAEVDEAVALSRSELSHAIAVRLVAEAAEPSPERTPEDAAIRAAIWDVPLPRPVRRKKVPTRRVH